MGEDVKSGSGEITLGVGSATCFCRPFIEFRSPTIRCATAWREASRAPPQCVFSPITAVTLRDLDVVLISAVFDIEVTEDHGAGGQVKETKLASHEHTRGQATAFSPSPFL